MVIDEIITKLTIKLGEKIIDTLFEESTITVFKTKFETWFSFTIQLKDGEIIRLSEAGEKINGIFDLYSSKYINQLPNIPMLSYNSNKFYAWVDFYWEEDEIEDSISEHISYLKNKEINYNEDNPIVSSFSIYIIPKSPSDINVILDMKKIFDEFTDKIMKEFNIFKPWCFLYFFSDKLDKIKKKFISKIGENLDDGIMGNRKYIRLINPSEITVQKIVKIFKYPW